MRDFQPTCLWAPFPSFSVEKTHSEHGSTVDETTAQRAHSKCMQRGTRKSVQALGVCCGKVSNLEHGSPWFPVSAQVRAPGMVSEAVKYLSGHSNKTEVHGRYFIRWPTFG